MLIEGLYTVAQFKLDENLLEATIKIHKEHEVFKGHFPGNPVMPGVCMIQIIKELTERALEKKLFLMTSSNIKFMAIINPEVSSELLLQSIIHEEEGVVKVKNTTVFGETTALKLSAQFKIVA